MIILITNYLISLYSRGCRCSRVLVSAGACLGFGAAAIAEDSNPVGWVFLGVQGLALAAEIAYAQQ